jgi:hypothetical protein
MTQTPAKKTAAKKAPAKKTVAPVVIEPKVPQYVALKRMTANGVDYQVGDIVPDAHTWLRLESRIRARLIKEV